MSVSFYGYSLTIEQQFEKANDLYTQAKYPEALETYKAILDSQFVSAELYYNIGNTYYKLNQIPKAILYYEKALQLNPKDADILHNLKLANLRTVDKIESAQNQFINTALTRLYLSKTPNQWAVYTIVLLFLAVLFFMVFMFTLQTVIKKVSFYASMFFVVVFLLTMFVGYQSKHLNEHPTHAIIMSPTISVYSEPNTLSTKLFSLHEGTKVKLLETYNSWQKIMLENGNSGWIKQTDLEEI
ncbi:MAG: tetratricopeptide repeat protein [Vicingaceae bacterium]